MKTLKILGCVCLVYLGACVIFALFPQDSPPITPEERAHLQEVRENCVVLSRTPMSAMTPKDLDDWSFCKTIMVPR